MQELAMRELREIELGILIAVRDFCKSNNIRYYLCGGTLLGAVRHSGFIPWDDDIDICMPRPDYERFISEFYCPGKYQTINYLNNHMCYLPYCKVVDVTTELREQSCRSIKGMGAFIDVFPLDGLGMTCEEAKKRIRDATELFYKCKLCVAKYRLPRSLNDAIIDFNIARYGMRKYSYLRKIQLIGETSGFDESEYVGCVFGYYNDREIMRYNYFSEGLCLKFENEEFKVPFDYNSYLTNLYGDYMELPPIEKRVTHHSFKVYWRNK